jgi:hypothetical protein
MIILARTYFFMINLKTTITLFFISWLMGCTKNSSSNSGGPDVFVTGYTSTGSAFQESVYWKNNTLVPLPGGAFATGIAFGATDIYVAGNANYTMPAGGGVTTEAVYWKNGTMVKLGNAPSYASSIVISGTDVYIAGIAEVNNVYCAVYWKNGMLSTLATTPYSVANAITISGTDVYVAGNTGATGYQAVYWKNGMLVPLENTVASKANAIAISGTDVYVAGNIVTGSSTNAAVYWKNGVRVNLNPAGTDTNVVTTYASAIAVSGTDVHVSGYMYPELELYWKNGVQVALNNPYNSPNLTNDINGIFLDGPDVYISFNNAAYWKNDTIVSVGSGYATNIAVRH